MDSKLKRLCMAGSLSVVILVVLLVVYVNNHKVNNRPNEQNGEGYSKEQSTLETTDSKTEGIQTDKGVQLGYSLQAFLKEEDFFDPVVEVEKVPDEKMLSLIVTSVEKDLRIRIENGNKDVVEGEEFIVKIAGLGEYKDSDKDGRIYISDITAGSYELVLSSLKDYVVPKGSVTINVKEKVEYVAIKDISLLIKTEADIDAQKEDARMNDALEDADKSEITKLQNDVAGTRVGIDVSKWNKEIEWNKVKAGGVEFAIIRAGYRGTKTGALVIDPYFEQNMRGAVEANVETGVYFFSQAISEVEAVEEASMVVRLLQDYDIKYPVFIDTEGVGGNGRADHLDAETRTKICEAFCETVQSEGYRAGVYACRNWFDNMLQTERLEKYDIWLAEYRKEPLYQGKYRMWQYTSKGRIDGIEGNVDMNIEYVE